MPEDKRVPWDRYPQVIWEEAIERYDQQGIQGISLSQRPIPPWEYYQDKMTRQQRMQKDSERFPSLAK
jgi:hypothetical protein